MKSFSKRIILLLFSFLIIISLYFLHSHSLIKPLEDRSISLLKIILYPFNKINSGINNFRELISSINNLQKENKNLKKEANQLRAEITKLKEIEKENQILREQLNFAQKTDYKLLPAEIISRGEETFFSQVIVNRGEKDGVKKGAFVLSDGYLIGKVIEVYNHSAKIMLITSPQSSVGAMIQDSRVNGVIKGELGGGLVMEMIPQNEMIRVGELVCTSGIGGDYPKGIIIGAIEEIKSKPDELFQKVSIKSPINFKKIELIFISL